MPEPLSARAVPMSFSESCRRFRLELRRQFFFVSQMFFDGPSHVSRRADSTNLIETTTNGRLLKAGRHWGADCALSTHGRQQRWVGGHGDIISVNSYSDKRKSRALL